MTDIELLPMSEGLADWLRGLGVKFGPIYYEAVIGWLKEYARANVEHHTAALQTEIEALRVRADAMAGRAIKYEARAERLEEALREAVADLQKNQHAAAAGRWAHTLKEITEEETTMADFTLFEQLEARVETWQQKYLTEKTRAERLAEAVQLYGEHTVACMESEVPACVCGLDALLEQLAEQSKN